MKHIPTNHSEGWVPPVAPRGWGQWIATVATPVHPVGVTGCTENGHLLQVTDNPPIPEDSAAARGMVDRPNGDAAGLSADPT